jgi:hypothetical protein
VRKLWCAGAIAGGILLFGAAPAQADALPLPSAAQAPLSPLGEALQETNNWRVTSPLAADPLSGEPLVDLSPGDQQLLRLQPGHNRIGRAEKQQSALPAADVVSGTLPPVNARNRTPGTVGRLPDPAPAALAARDAAVGVLPFDALMNSGSTVFTALGPDGLPVAQNTQISGVTESARAKKAGGDLPLVGGIGTAGLGGAVPVSAGPVDGVKQRIDNIGADVSGLPLGGTPVSPQSARSARPGTPDTDETPAASRSGAPVDPVTAGTAEPSASAATPAPSPSSAAPSVPGHHKSHAAEPSPATSAGIAPRDKIDDPRLLEEPTEGLN